MNARLRPVLLSLPLLFSLCSLAPLAHAQDSVSMGAVLSLTGSNATVG
jgi:branched-chain amino acid transport system substrate-binding protein